MGQPIRLLVIDDNVDTHELLDMMFASSQVFHAHNGREGLEQLEAHPDVDAIVLDLAMPILDGYTFLERMVADRRFRLVPVCVFTANRNEAIKALGLGARDFIDKRADYQELQLRILNLVDSKRRVAEATLSKTDFLSVVSHELRTPMNGILGMAEAIRDGALVPEQVRYLDILEQSARKMTALVNDVLQFLESENPLHGLPRTQFDLRQVVYSVLERLSDEATRNDTVVESVVHPSVADALIGLPDKLGLILHHLVGNAIKFSPGRKVVVAVELAGSGEGQVGLTFSVRDTGVGFPEGWKERIFDPFTQVDGSQTRRFGGLGIGLSVAGRMVQMLGGNLEVESEPGRGSRFQFSLTFPSPAP